MKKILVMVLTLFLISAFMCGCQKEEPKQEDELKTENQEEEEIIELGDAVDDYFVVYVDPGHGFDDPGCSSDLLKGTEAKNTLAIAKILKEKLEKAGAVVHLTHDGENFPSAQEVRAIAKKYNVPYDEEYVDDNNIYSATERATYMTALCNEEDIDFFISLHINSIEGYPKRSRYELYYCETNPKAAELEVMCQNLGGKFDNTTFATAMPFKDAYLVVKYAPIPSLLVEMGYCTNEKDAKKLNSDSWRQDFTDILTEEIMLWNNEAEK